MTKEQLKQRVQQIESMAKTIMQATEVYVTEDMRFTAFENADQIRHQAELILKQLD